MTLSATSIMNNSDTPREASPVNTGATPAAQALLQYLYSVRDRGKVLSAQHVYLDEDDNEAEHVAKLTGKYPAIVEIDLRDFKRRPDLKERRLNFAKAWHQAGGLVGVSWHETNPELSSLDEGGYQYGAKKKMSQARFEELITPGSELHQRWLEHVDLAAGWLRELQNADVPVLWRPYHEMTGGWFWWGEKKPESFCQLWMMMYDRLTRHHQLDNLLWVWSAAMLGDDYAAYLPLDYVDVAGIDLYYPSRADQGFAERAAQIEEAAQGKPVALAEVGTLPELDILHNHTGFVWFTVWRRGWLDNEHYPKPQENGPGNCPAWIQEVYASPKVITRDALPG